MRWQECAKGNHSRGAWSPWDAAGHRLAVRERCRLFIGGECHSAPSLKPGAQVRNATAEPSEKRTRSPASGEPLAFVIGQDWRGERLGFGPQPFGTESEVCGAIGEHGFTRSHLGARGVERGGGREVGGRTRRHRGDVSPRFRRGLAAGDKNAQEQQPRRMHPSRREVVQVPCSVPAASGPLLARQPERGKRQARPTNDRIARTTTTRPTR